MQPYGTSRQSARVMDSGNLASWVNVVLGAWLIIAPFVLGYISGQAYWNSILVGIAVGVIALIRVASPYGTQWLSWVNVALGVWLIIAPFVLNDTVSAAYWNDVIVGAVIVLVALWSAMTATRATTNSRTLPDGDRTTVPPRDRVTG